MVNFVRGPTTGELQVEWWFEAVSSVEWWFEAFTPTISWPQSPDRPPVASVARSFHGDGVFPPLRGEPIQVAGSADFDER